MATTVTPNIEPAHDILRRERPALDVFFKPKVERVDPKSSKHEILAVGRLSKVKTTNEAEVAVVIIDEFQHQGLGTKLFRQLTEIARDEKIERIIAETLSEN